MRRSVLHQDRTEAIVSRNSKKKEERAENESRVDSVLIDDGKINLKGKNKITGKSDYHALVSQRKM
jgi:hypothetical protein